MKTKELFVKIKELSEDGTFEGLLSPYGNVDEGGDVVDPGAYEKTLKEGGVTRPLLWQHRDPIGEIVLEDSKEGLRARGRLLMDLSAAKDAYLLIKANIVRGLSIGYKTIKDSVENGVRHLKEVKLLEGSIVTFPMNEMALIDSVKDAQKSGARYSAESKAAIRAIADHFKVGYESLIALTADGAAESTPPEEAAKTEPVTNHSAVEPEDLHSAAVSLKSIRDLIPR